LKFSFNANNLFNNNNLFHNNNIANARRKLYNYTVDMLIEQVHQTSTTIKARRSVKSQRAESSSRRREHAAYFFAGGRAAQFVDLDALGTSGGAARLRGDNDARQTARYKIFFRLNRRIFWTVANDY